MAAPGQRGWGSPPDLLEFNNCPPSCKYSLFLASYSAGSWQCSCRHFWRKLVIISIRSLPYLWEAINFPPLPALFSDWDFSINRSDLSHFTKALVSTLILPE